MVDLVYEANQDLKESDQEDSRQRGKVVYQEIEDQERGGSKSKEISKTDYKENINNSGGELNSPLECAIGTQKD